MIKKLAILIGSSIGLFSLWLVGLEKLYANLLYWGAKVLLSPFSNVISVLNTKEDHPAFCMAIGGDGYCMELELFGLSIIVMLSWYILFVSLKPGRERILIAFKHLGIFYILQVLSMLTIGLYKYGTFYQQMNDALRQSFIIIALVFIIWDNYLHGIFKFGNKNEK